LKKTGKAFFDANSNRRKTLLPLCLEAAAQMKLEGARPDRQTYHVLMESATNAGAWRIGQAILDDMLLVGIKPDTEMFNILIHVRRRKYPKMVNDNGDDRRTVNYALPFYGRFSIR
jgi:hypothetical protein